MKTPVPNKDELSQNLGKLFYAIAVADKTIRQEEIDAFNNALKKGWDVPDIDSTQPNSGIPKQIQFHFMQLKQTNADSETCFLEFSTFFKTHPILFDGNIKKLIWETAQSIASSFAQKNKSELIILAKLKLLLQS